MRLLAQLYINGKLKSKNFYEVVYLYAMVFPALLESHEDVFIYNAGPKTIPDH